MSWQLFLNRFHVWRFNFILYDCLNKRFTFHYFYDKPGSWIATSDKIVNLLSQDDDLDLTCDCHYHPTYGFVAMGGCPKHD